MAVLRTLSILAVAALPAGCAVTSGVDDFAITSNVRSRMADDPTVGTKRIKVQTLNGLVQLSGFASSAEEKARAAQIARRVKHVEEVRNDIIVRAADGGAD